MGFIIDRLIVRTHSCHDRACCRILHLIRYVSAFEWSSLSSAGATGCAGTLRQPSPPLRQRKPGLAPQE